MKFLFSLLLIIFSSSSFSQVTFKWLGTSGFILSDQSTTLMFDPAMTHVPIYDFLPFMTVQSDKPEVDFWMNKCGLKSLQGTFVNHAHTDHVIDAPYVVKKFGGKLYGSSSVVNVGLGQGLTNLQVQKIKHGDSWKIGDFIIRPFRTPHAPHVLDIMLMDGHIEKPLPTPTSPWNYLVGETHSFLISHPKGSILFQATGQIHDIDTLKGLKADVLLLTIANRKSSEDLIQKRVNPSQAKKIIPLHHDNFFIPMKRENGIDELWGVKVSEFQEKLSLHAKQIKSSWPQYCQSISLF